MMKKFFATLLCLALVAGLFAACSGSKDNNAKADSKKVGIAVLSENGAFTDMRTGIESKLKEKYGGATPAETVKAMLLPGEIEDLSRAVERLCGFRRITIDEVKNA